MTKFTKKAIISTFLDLLHHKSLDKITNKDIVDKCGINRNTFYYHYKDIYDLIDDIFITESKKVLEKTIECENLETEFKHIVKFIMEYKVAIKHLYDSKSRDELEKYLFTITELFVQKYIEKQAMGLSISHEHLEFVCDFYRFYIGRASCRETVCAIV